MVGPPQPLIEAVRDRVQAQTGRRPEGPVRLLTHPRYFGFGFNPVSLFYCYQPDGVTLDALVAEVTNTPWLERHVYVLPITCNLGSESKPAFRCAKDFHVSPFLPMDLEYAWHLNRPGQHLVLHMADLDRGDTVFDATLNLTRQTQTGPGPPCPSARCSTPGAAIPGPASGATSRPTTTWATIFTGSGWTRA